MCNGNREQRIAAEIERLRGADEAEIERLADEARGATRQAARTIRATRRTRGVEPSIRPSARGTRMSPSPTVLIRLTPEMRAALDAWCTRHQVALSSLLRDAALREIGRTDLIETMRRPGGQTAQPATKKRRRK